MRKEDFGPDQVVPAESFEAAFEPGSEGHPSLAGLGERPPGGLWDEKRGQCREEAAHSAKHEDKHFCLAYIHKKTAIYPQNSPGP